MVDKVLFEDMNRNKKSAVFKKNALQQIEQLHAKRNEMEYQEVPSLAIQRGYQPDSFDLEKFEDYCYFRKPSRFSKDFVLNDRYFYSALLYSIWTGKCHKKDAGEEEAAELKREFAKMEVGAEDFFGCMAHNLENPSDADDRYDIAHMVEALGQVRQK